MKNTCFEKDFEMYCLFAANYVRVTGHLPDIESWTVSLVEKWLDKNGLVINDGKFLYRWRDEYNILVHYDELVAKL